MSKAQPLGAVTRPPTVAVVGSGGTIANTSSGRIGITRVLRDIKKQFPESDPAAHVDVRYDVRRGGAEMSVLHWIEVARAVGEAAADPRVDGVVVTHGTFTVEETAYFLHLVLDTDKPIVVTCSQRRHGMIGNDGDRNLIDAIRVACSPDARRHGVMLVANEEIHSARDVIKSNQRPGGFWSRSSGILGSIESDQVTFYRRPNRRHTSSSEFRIPPEPLPRVDIVTSYVGADEVAVDAFVAAGARGLVILGFSYDGRPYHLQLESLHRAIARGLAVVLVSRGADGRIPADSGGVFVTGDNLTPHKARILLALALAQGNGRDLKRIFGEY